MANLTFMTNEEDKIELLQTETVEIYAVNEYTDGTITVDALLKYPSLEHFTAEEIDRIKQNLNKYSFTLIYETGGTNTIYTKFHPYINNGYLYFEALVSPPYRGYCGTFGDVVARYVWREVLNSSYKMSNVVLYDNNLYLAIKTSFTATKTPDLDTTNWRNWSSKDNDILGIYAHIIGNGDSESSRDNAYTLKWTSEAWYKGAVTTTGADYAEYFEWVDGNPNTEDRVGHFVTLEGDKIIIANESSDIIGVVSAAPAIIGDSYESSWQGKYLTDIFGRIIYEDVEVEYEDSSINDEGDEVVSKHTKIESRPKLNPNYDNSHEYIPRSKRPE